MDLTLSPVQKFLFKLHTCRPVLLLALCIFFLNIGPAPDQPRIPAKIHFLLDMGAAQMVYPTDIWPYIICPLPFFTGFPVSKLPALLALCILSPATATAFIIRFCRPRTFVDMYWLSCQVLFVVKLLVTTPVIRLRSIMLYVRNVPALVEGVPDYQQDVAAEWQKYMLEKARISNAVRNNRAVRAFYTGIESTLKLMNGAQLGLMKTLLEKRIDALDDEIASRDVRAMYVALPCGHAMEMAAEDGAMGKCAECGAEITAYERNVRFARHVPQEQMMLDSYFLTRHELKKAGLWEQHKQCFPEYF